MKWLEMEKKQQCRPKLEKQHESKAYLCGFVSRFFCGTAGAAQFEGTQNDVLNKNIFLVGSCAYPVYLESSCT